MPARADFDEPDRRALMVIAGTAIQAGLQGMPPSVDIENMSAALRQPRATFVTLMERGVLRGCIGTLEASRALATDVAENAYGAAFRDPRFPPVSAVEVERLDIHISILGAPEPMVFATEADLIRQLRPGTDGLILAHGGEHATFLPSVWESVRDPRDFVHQLKLKAGLPADAWPPAIQVARYTVSSIP